MNTFLLALMLCGIVAQAALYGTLIADQKRGVVRMRVSNAGAWVGVIMVLLALTRGDMINLLAAVLCTVTWFMVLHRQRDAERTVAQAVDRAREGWRLSPPEDL